MQNLILHTEPINHNISKFNKVIILFDEFTKSTEDIDVTLFLSFWFLLFPFSRMVIFWQALAT